MTAGGVVVIPSETPTSDLHALIRATMTRLARTAALPALPTVATAALAIARDDAADVADLTRLIQTDVGLSARLLRLANSAATGRRRSARTLDEAVVTIGIRKACDVLAGVCARSLYETPNPRTQALWVHAVATAVAAEELAAHTRAVAPGQAFLPALFHDVGRIAFILADDRTADIVDALAARVEEEAVVVEREWYGFDHAELGAVLAEDWGLAPEQCDAILEHHHPADGSLAALVNAADAIAYALGAGGSVRQPATVACAGLGLSPDDEAACVDRTRAALAEYRDVLG